MRCVNMMCAPLVFLASRVAHPRPPSGGWVMLREAVFGVPVPCTPVYTNETRWVFQLTMTPLCTQRLDYNGEQCDPQQALPLLWPGEAGGS